MDMDATKDYYDVCIIGAGPAALACLSAICEPYSVNSLRENEFQRALHSNGLHQKQRVCIIDPSGEWLHSWKQNFDTLCIKHLRSPVLGHCDMFDDNALLAYACRHGRDQDELLESGCWDCKDLLALGQTQIGLWKLPSLRLFVDFCDNLAERLPHTFFHGIVVDIDEEPDGAYRLKFCDPSGLSRNVFSRNVILAPGVSGCPVVPRGLDNCRKVVSWNDPAAFSDTKPSNMCTEKRILVVGGGLTAVQAALRVVQDGHDCVLCSRRPLQEKHFDIPVEWFDLRKSNKHLSEIYHNDMASRLRLLKEARNGGSVPSMYMKLINENTKKLTCRVGEVEYIQDEPQCDGKMDVTVTIGGVRNKFDKIILACGVNPDCLAHPLFAKIVAKWPIATHGGFPELTQDLHWSNNRCNLFVVGAMAGLQVGPDAGNLMGMRRAARVVANALDCRSWLREKALANPFEALWSSDSDSEEDEDSLGFDGSIYRQDIQDDGDTGLTMVTDLEEGSCCESVCSIETDEVGSKSDCSTCGSDLQNDSAPFC